MSCDGTPGNPGLERVGDELYVCTGCYACKVPYDHIPLEAWQEYLAAVKDEAAREAAGLPRKPVPCKSTAHGEGCGHYTAEHVGPSTPNADCACCNWSQNVVGPLPDSMIRSKQLTPEDMAAKLGVDPEGITAAITEQMAMYTKMMQAIAEKMKPPPTPSRPMRRAMKFGHVGLHGRSNKR